jgi:hypothetical protein
MILCFANTFYTIKKGRVLFPSLGPFGPCHSSRVDNPLHVLKMDLNGFLDRFAKLPIPPRDLAMLTL